MKQFAADTGLDAVTGAFGFSGAAIARRLVADGRSVRTLTNHPPEVPRPIDVRPFDFGDLPGLVDSLAGVSTLYNTYWVRFPHGRSTFELAVANSRTLFQAAHRAGVQRVVHVSITHANADSPYGYFRGKGLVERALAESGVSHAVLRPAILFGPGGVLLNNIAWLLRHVPVFAVGGDGGYRIRPIHIDDLAELAVSLARPGEDIVVDAVGPERPTFDELLRILRRAVGSRSRIVHVPGRVLTTLSGGLNLVLRDVLLTSDEYFAMAGGLADSEEPSTGRTLVSEWIAANAHELGRAYANELDRHFRPGRRGGA